MYTLLRLTIAIPFLFILPGFFLTKILFPSLDRIEKSTLSVLLSMVIVYVSLFAVEKILGKLTSFNTTLTIVIVNLLCVTIFVIAHRKQSKPS